MRVSLSRAVMTQVWLASVVVTLCSSLSCGSEDAPVPKASDVTLVTRAFTMPSTSTVTVEIDIYWFDESRTLNDDLDFWAEVTIGSNTRAGDGFYFRDLAPGCCSAGVSPIDDPRGSNFSISRTIPNQPGPVRVNIAMYENDGGHTDQVDHRGAEGDDLQNIAGTGDAISLDVNLVTGKFTGEFQSENDDCRGGCRVCTGPPDINADGICFTIRVENPCIALPPGTEPGAGADLDDPELGTDFNNVGKDARWLSFGDLRGTCDSIDNDCDGLFNEDYTEIPAALTCGFCPVGSRSMCVDGEEIPSCESQCERAPELATLMNYIASFDFDVAADKLCMIDAVGAVLDANNGPPDIFIGDDPNDPEDFCVAARVACTTQALGVDGLYEVLPAPASFSSVCATTAHVTMDPSGRVWATNSIGLYTQKRLAASPAVPDLEFVAANPAGCSTIVQIESVGPVNRDFFGPSALVFALCSNGALFELDMSNLSNPAWKPRAERVGPSFDFFSMPIGASPSTGFDLFFLNPDQSLQGLLGGLLADPFFPGPGLVGGVYVYGMGGTTDGVNLRIQQWNGSALENVADLGKPLPSPSPFLGYYDDLVPFTTFDGGRIRKLVEGGGAGLGGPSPANTIDALWFLNDSQRVYAYNVKVGTGSGHPYLSDPETVDNVPITAKALLGGGFNIGPTAVCRDVTLSAGPTCTAILTDPTLVDAGSFDPEGGSLSLSLSRSGAFPRENTPVSLRASDGFTSATCSATVTVNDDTPPVLSVPPNPNATVCFGGGVVTVGQATATDNCATSLVPTGAVTIKDGFLLATPIPVVGGQAFLTPGSYVVQWSVGDGRNAAGLTQTVTVAPEAIAPVLSLPADVTKKICRTTATVQVGQATAADACPVTVTGQVIATNGVNLPTPIAITNGQATLPIGRHTVRWTASDGFNTTPGTQIVTVNPTIESSQSFDLQDRAQLRDGAGGFAAVLNAGTGSTHLGQDVRSGAILSVGPVSIQHRTIVEGPVISRVTVSKDSDATVNGTITQNGTVALPALPTLPSFPPATGGSITVNTGTMNRAPGSYTTASVNGGTLLLASGDYFFQSLTINSNGTVRVTPTTRVFVRDALTMNAPFRASTGTAVQALFFGFAGATLDLPTRLDGTVLAPNATVAFGSGAGVTFTGSFYARTLRVNQASALVCSP